jgi:hypothetical protein
MKTGQTTSYRTGDDGDIEAGRATSFFVLPSNNPFGNTNRFTDELGGQTYTNNIVIDWSTYDGATVLGYTRSLTLTGNISWDTAVDGALTYSTGGFSNVSGGDATSGQGNAGGAATAGSGYTGAGGGGAGAAGVAAGGTSTGGAGGIGSSVYSSWGSATNTGQNVSGTRYYAGGGGGSSQYLYGFGAGGLGGGGRGADERSGNTPSVAGTANTGGGGGGGMNYNGGDPGTQYNGMAGGSGIIIIRYLK